MNFGLRRLTRAIAWWNPLPAALRARNSFRGKLLRSVLASTAIALTVAGMAMLTHDLGVYRSSWATDLSNQASIVALSVAPALAFDDHAAAQRALAALKDRPRMLGAALYSADGALYAAYRLPGEFEAPPRAPDWQGVRVLGERVELVQPISHDGEPLGKLYLRANYDVVGRIKAYAGIFALVMILSLVAASFFANRLQASITAPLDDMVSAARHIVYQNDYSQRAKKTTEDEIGVVVDAFNRMLDEVQLRTRALERSNEALQQEIETRQTAESALRVSEGLYRAIGESIEYGVWVCAPDGRNVYASESFLRLTGQTQEICSNYGWGEALHPDDRDATLAAWRDCIRSGGVWYREQRIRGLDGAYHPILAQGVPIKSEAGELTGWAGINLDISRLKRTEQALRDADRRKDEFLATLAHELRNPLAPIRHAVKVLESEAVDTRQREWAREVIARQVQRMALMLDDLLDVSRITRGRLDLKLDLVDLDALVKAAVEIARPMIDSKHQRLSIALPPHDLRLKVDPLRLSQSLSNLLTNAAKYTDLRGEITLSVRQLPEEVSFSVRDNGIGIDPDTITGLFEMFSQVNSALDRAEGGLGIGLALVKGLVTLHGGRVEATSAGIGHGSEFTIYLPGSVIVSQDSEESTGTVSSDESTGAGLRVLVADDNRDAADSLALVLQLGGYDVAVAHTASKAFELAARTQPEAAIFDIGMPDMTGYELAQRIRQQPWGRSMFLLAVTGWGQKEDKERAKSAGFDHHLTKPVDPDHVETLLQALLHGRRTAGSLHPGAGGSRHDHEP